MAVLKTLGQELNFMVHGLAAVSLDGQVVSSTRVREALRAGQLDFAAQLLGRGYSLAGPVVRGEGLGRRLGFPTANIDTTGLVLPPTGVYAVHAQVRPVASPLVENAPPLPNLTEESGKKDLVQPSGTGPDAALSSRIYRAVLNIGYRPTVTSQTLQPQVEAHLFDFTEDIYGQEMEITFIEKLRDEQKFPSLEALQRQIALDIATAKKLFTNRRHPPSGAET